MAVQLKLLRLRDLDATEFESLSLLSWAAGFDLADNGWLQNCATDDDVENSTPIEEMITLNLKATSHDALATYDTALKKLLRKARWYRESPSQYGVWLRAQLTNESHARQALIVNADTGRVNLMRTATIYQSQVGEYPMRLVRMPLWEATANASHTASGVSSVGGTSDAIVGLAGTDSARIAEMHMIGSAGVHLTEFWCGFRSARNGVVANYEPHFELELGTADKDTAVATDATASPGGGGNTKMTCTFATTTTRASRVTLTAQQATGNYEDMRGTFDVILRAKCTNTAAARVWLSSGMSGSSSYRYCNPVAVTGTAWKLYNVGRVSLPAGGKVPPAAISAMYYSTLQIEASLTSGSGNLDLDVLIMIPVDEGYFHVSGGISHGCDIFNSPLGQVYSIAESASDEYNGLLTMNTSAEDLTIPIPTAAGGTVVSIWAAQRNAGSTLADELTFTAYFYNRWRTLRGDDS